MYQELKLQVQQRMDVVTQELDEIAKMLRNFEIENDEEHKPVFSLTLDFYQRALKYDTKLVLSGLDEEITVA